MDRTIPGRRGRAAAVQQRRAVGAGAPRFAGAMNRRGAAQSIPTTSEAQKCLTSYTLSDMPMVSIRISDEEKELWVTEAGGGRNLSKWIRSRVNAGLGGRGVVEVVREARPAPPVSRSAGRVSGPKPAAATAPRSPSPGKKHDPGCTNRSYHWKGFCRFCGGG